MCTIKLIANVNATMLKATFSCGVIFFNIQGPPPTKIPITSKNKPTPKTGNQDRRSLGEGIMVLLTTVIKYSQSQKSGCDTRGEGSN